MPDLVFHSYAHFSFSLTSPFSAHLLLLPPFKSPSRYTETPAELPLGGWGRVLKEFCRNLILPEYNNIFWRSLRACLHLVSVSLPYPLASFGFLRHWEVVSAGAPALPPKTLEVLEVHVHRAHSRYLNNIDFWWGMKFQEILPTAWVTLHTLMKI